MKKYINSVFGKVLFILIALSFIIVGGISSGISNGSKVAKIKNESISFNDFYRTYTLQARQMRLDPALLSQMGIAHMILNNMIGETTTFAKAKSVGIVATDVSLASHIKNTPTFQLNGQFDAQQYQAVLQANNLTEESYVNSLKQGLTNAKYMNAFSTFQLHMPKAVNILYKNSEQSRTLIQAQKSLDAMPTPNVNQTDLQTYYQDNQQSFEVPENRSITAIYLDNESVAKSISNADAEQYFKENAGAFDTPETRSYYTIGGIKADLEKIIKLVHKGTPLKTAVNKVLKQDINTLLNKDVSKENVETALRQTVFSTKQGSISTIIKGPFSDIIVYVKSIKPAKIATFKDVVKTVKKTMAYEKIFDKTIDIEDAVADANSLKDIGKRINIPAIHLNITDNIPNTYPFANNKVFLDTVYEMQQGDVSDIQDLGNETFVIVQLDTIKDAYIPPLSDIKNDVKKQFIANEKTKALNAQLTTLDKITDKSTFYKTAQSLGFKVKTLKNQKEKTLKDTSLSMAFTTKVNTVISDIQDNIGTSVFSIFRSVPKTVPADKQKEFDNIITNDVSRPVAYGLQKEFMKQIPADINQQLVNSVYSIGNNR